MRRVYQVLNDGGRVPFDRVDRRCTFGIKGLRHHCRIGEANCCFWRATVTQIGHRANIFGVNHARIFFHFTNKPVA